MNCTQIVSIYLLFKFDKYWIGRNGIRLKLMTYDLMLHILSQKNESNNTNMTPT
jgi:hypothetical protein